MSYSSEKAAKAPARDQQVEDTVINWSRERPDLDFDWLRIVLRIRRLERILRDEQSTIMPEMGGGHGELEVVGQLRSAGPPYSLRPTDLFLALSLTSGTMTGRISRLMALDWVSRAPSSSDGRAWTIGLTKKGKAVSDRLAEHGAVDSALARALARMDDAGRSALLELLDQLHRLVQEEHDASQRAASDIPPG